MKRFNDENNLILPLLAVKPKTFNPIFKRKIFLEENKEGWGWENSFKLGNSQIHVYTHPVL